MKRYAFIAALILLVGTTGYALADKGPGGGDQPRLMAPRDGQGGEEKNDDHGGIFGNLFRHDAHPQGPNTALQEDRQKIVDLKQQRQDLQQDRDKIISDSKEERAAAMQALKARQDALKTEIAQVKKEKPTIRKEFVETHFTTAIANLHTITDRIQSKIDELDGKGYDMTDVKKSLSDATTSLQSAEDQFAALKAATVSDGSDTSVTKPREIAKKIEELLKQTRDSLHESVQAMKTAIGIPEDSSEDDSDTATATTSQQ